MTEIPEVYAKSRKYWRDWLRKNHSKERIVHLIKYKRHTGKPTLNNREAMEEAICFGWIDTTIKRIDEEKYRQCFVRRNKNSRWSNNTLRIAGEMIKKRKMAKAGLHFYEEGKKKPTIDHGLPKNPDIPEDLQKALDENKKAKQNFAAFAPSYRRLFIYWVMKAKRPETKKNRIKRVVDAAKENKKNFV